MSNLTIWQGNNVPAATPQISQSMQQHELIAHRKEICSDVEVILDGYWKDRPGVKMKARILSDWADTLQDFKHESILKALRMWRNGNPDKKPNPGHILSILKEGWGKKVVKETQPAQDPEPTSDRVTPERAAEIMREAYGDEAAPSKFTSNRTEK